MAAFSLPRIKAFSGLADSVGNMNSPSPGWTRVAIAHSTSAGLLGSTSSSTTKMRGRLLEGKFAGASGNRASQWRARYRNCHERAAVTRQSGHATLERAHFVGVA